MTNNIDKEEILQELYFFQEHAIGIENWLYFNPPGDDESLNEIFGRLSSIPKDPLTRSQLNQLLILSHKPGVSEGFFKYYWGDNPQHHPYKVTKLNSYHREYLNHTKIQSLGHFKWGWERLFIDGLLFYGNVNKCFKHIKSFTYKELVDFYKSKCFFADQIQRRGEFLEIENIADKDRYLISEMACKNLSDARQYEKRLEKRLKSAWNKYEKYCRTKTE